MTLSALLVCVDEKAADVLGRVLKELGIQVELCSDIGRAVIRTAQERFDVVIVDGESGADVISLLRETRLSRKNDATLAVALVPSQDAIRELFSLGVNFVLYKPVAYERALSSLRAARALMRKEKRKDARASVHAHATVDYANIQQEKATLVDLAKNGMAVRFGKKLPPTSKVYFQFRLPQQTQSVRLSGQLVWQDWNGRGGVQFVDVPKASRRLLDEFLGANLQKDMQQERPDVTVEMEEPIPVASVAAAEHSHDSETTQPAGHQVAVLEYTPSEQTLSEQNREESKAAAMAEVDANNRRAQTRYACRLGAEVYRTGTSVPNRCCLTDLSSGGCYLEVPLPFPKGASVEILVRTHEMKLRLRGTVLASHPGFGMGIAFELRTKEEQANVKKLTDFVTSAQA
jgi:CheY-like chemotaxis protein/c-di-GMP-binding flagellar brake protein YcgR